MELELPDVIGGKYRVLRLLGRGAMGAVYTVEHVNTGERLAMKVMSVDTDNPEFVERFRREARATARIASEHVVRVTDADMAAELGGAPFIVMELLTGIDLANLLAERGRLAAYEVLDYLQQAGRGIDRAHAAGIVHRDLKPENLFLHTTPEGRRIVKVLDFGIARVMDGEVTMLTRAGAMVGTPMYMAPEQAPASAGEIGKHTDIWAMGMIAVELLTGEAYWTAETTMALLAQVLHSPLKPPSERFGFLPRSFDDWFLRSCARDPKERWASVSAQMDALAGVLEGMEDEVTMPLDAGSGRRSTPAPGYQSSAKTAALGPRGSRPNDRTGSRPSGTTKIPSEASKTPSANRPPSGASPVSTGELRAAGAAQPSSRPPAPATDPPSAATPKPDAGLPPWMLAAGAIAIVAVVAAVIGMKLVGCDAQSEGSPSAVHGTASASPKAVATPAASTPEPVESAAPHASASASAAAASASAAPSSAPAATPQRPGPKPAPTAPAPTTSAAATTTAAPAAPPKEEPAAGAKDAG